mmetsp:Transcript_24881/g.36699  ORF Transcript_24881/g.36699 Transcript_24881/m.36699 type:complete len:305 (-) Transcript_24881:135-1049(-)
MDFFFVIGITGIGIYATLFLYCVFQIALFIRAINKDYQFLIHKLSFHVMYGVYSLLECLYFVSLFVYDYYVRWGTAIHLMALYWNLLAFVTIIMLWSVTTYHGRISKTQRYVGRIFLGFNLVSTIADIILWCITLDENNSLNPLRSTLTLIYVFSLLMLSLGLYVHGYRLKLKLRLSIPRGSPDAATIKAKMEAVYQRINAVLIVCILCYGLRAILILVLVCDRAALYDIPLLVWFVLTAFIPTIGPGITFLYIMRYQPEHCSPSSNEDSVDVIKSPLGQAEEGSETIPSIVVMGDMHSNSSPS